MGEEPQLFINVLSLLRENNNHNNNNNLVGTNLPFFNHINKLPRNKLNNSPPLK